MEKWSNRTDDGIDLVGVAETAAALDAVKIVTVATLRIELGRSGS